MRFSCYSKRLILLFLFFCLPLPAVVSAGLKDFQGQDRRIQDYLTGDKWLVVMIWESHCPICNREAYQYVDFHEFHKDTDATVLGISIDGAAKKADAEDFIKRHSVTFPNLLGEVMDVMTLYTDLTDEFFRGTPTILVFSPQGTLMARETGAVPTQVIEDFIKQNSPAAN